MILHPDLEVQLSLAVSHAMQERYEFITTESFLLQLLQENLAREILTSAGAKLDRLQKNLSEHLSKHSTLIAEDEDETVTPQISAGLQRVLQRAWMQAINAGKSEIMSSDILISIYGETDSHALYFLEDTERISKLKMLQVVSHQRLASGTDGSQTLADDDGMAASGGGYSQVSPLKEFCLHLNDYVKNTDNSAIYPRESIYERIYQILSRKSKNNPLLIGDAGVGKTTLVMGLAQKINANEVPAFLKDAQIYLLDTGSLLAGTKFKGEFEERVTQIFQELEKHKKKTILFIDDLHALMNSSSANTASMDITSLLKPFLMKAKVSVIAASSYKDSKQSIEKNRSLERNFQKLEIPEPNDEESIKILNTVKESLEKHHHVKYSQEILENCIRLSKRFLSARFLPDKAIDVLDEMGARARLTHKDKATYTLTIKDLEDTVSSIAQVPSQNISTEDQKALKNLERDLKLNIFGQDVAVQQVASAVKFSRAGLQRSNKPIGSFLFAGPTGVGKTELARQLAAILNLKFIKFDMSEYMEKHAVSRLVGAPPGYVGYEEGGLLTDAIHKSPYSLILFDEVEKAHPDLMNILLQLMDDATLTDSNGKKVDCRNVIVIMTTNAGTVDMTKAGLGIAREEVQSFNLDMIKKSFSPEFLNRLDAIISFKHLSRDILLKVVEKFIVELQNQMQDKKIRFRYKPDVLKFILDKAYEPAYGARPLQRKINEWIKAPLVDEILFGKLTEGGEVEVILNKDKLDFKY